MRVNASSLNLWQLAPPVESQSLLPGLGGGGKIATSPLAIASAETLCFAKNSGYASIHPVSLSSLNTLC